MTILLIAQVFPPRTGGSGRWIWELYRRLAELDVTVAAGDCDGDLAFDAEASLRIQRLPLDFASWGVLSPRATLQHARALLTLYKLATSRRPSQIHCAKSLPEGLLGLALHRILRVPFTCYAHGEELQLARTSRELRLLTSTVLSGASRIIANSRFTQDELLKTWRVPAPKVAVLHPGVDATRFTPAMPDATVRRQLGWGGRRVVLTVGTLQKRKGQDTLIRALPAIRAACPDVLYVLVGPEKERSYLEEVAREEGVFEFVQFRGNPSDDELLACYQQCDVFALPNRSVGWDVEGFGMVLVEAQACGKPVVAGRSGGTTDALRDGITGYLIDATSPESVAAAVLELLTTPALSSTMGRNARQWALERFDWCELVPQALELFAPTAGAHGVLVA